MATLLSPEQASELRHELRTCLNQIGGYCGLLRDELTPPIADAVRVPLATILDRSDELLAMVGEHMPRGVAVTAVHAQKFRAVSAPVQQAIEIACSRLRQTPECLDCPGANADLVKIEAALTRWSELLNQVPTG